MKLHTKATQEADLEADFSFAISASDTVDITRVGAKIHVNKSGTYNLLLSANSTPVKMFLIAGVVYPFRVRRLYVTDTDAAIVDGLVGISSVYIETDKN